MATLSTPPKWVTSGGESVGVEEVRVFLLREDPRTASDDLTIGYDSGVLQWCWNATKAHWWDAHAQYDEQLTGSQVKQYIENALIQEPDLYTVVLLIFRLDQVYKHFTQAAVQGAPVEVDPQSSMSDLPWEHSRRELAVWAITQSTAPFKPDNPTPAPSRESLRHGGTGTTRGTTGSRLYTRAELETIAEQQGIDKPCGLTMTELVNVVSK